MKNKTAISQLTKTPTPTGFGNSQGEIKKRVGVGAGNTEKRLGYMPVAQMLAEIHAVFPNAKIL
jgi:hypothetical protein